MGDTIHVRLDSLSSVPIKGAEVRASVGAPSGPRPGVDGRNFFIETFGCQMNVHDSEKVVGVLAGRGYSQVESIAEADFVFYNTCSIREKAAQKVFSRLGEFRGSGQKKVIGVLGCLAQQEGEDIFERAPWVSLVCGSASYSKLPELLTQVESGGRRVMGLDLDTEATFETEITRRDNPFRAYLTIIEGCDYACSYCVVPHTRGPERSRRSAAVLAEVRQLAELGYSEIQLLGQTVNSYRDPSAAGFSFAQLLREVAVVGGIQRVRFTTSHPNDFGQDIVDAIEEVPEICNHVHLPVQSGSSRILKAMLRTYTREEYLEKIRMIRAAKREIAITTDIIVGFPGETETDFEETLSLLNEVGYDGVYSFTYSPRPNTPARDMVDSISEPAKAARHTVLQDRQRGIQVAYNETLVRREFDVLVDSQHRSKSGQEPGQWSGRTSCNRIVNFGAPAAPGAFGASGEGNLLGRYVKVRVQRGGQYSLVGSVVS